VMEFEEAKGVLNGLDKFQFGQRIWRGAKKWGQRSKRKKRLQRPSRRPRRAEEPVRGEPRDQPEMGVAMTERKSIFVARLEGLKVVVWFLRI